MAGKEIDKSQFEGVISYGQHYMADNNDTRKPAVYGDWNLCVATQKADMIRSVVQCL